MSKNGIILDQKEIIMIKVERQWRASQSLESVCQFGCFSAKLSIMRAVFMYFTVPSKRRC